MLYLNLLAHFPHSEVPIDGLDFKICPVLHYDRQFIPAVVLYLDNLCCWLAVSDRYYKIHCNLFIMLMFGVTQKEHCNEMIVITTYTISIALSALVDHMEQVQNALDLNRHF